MENAVGGGMDAVERSLTARELQTALSALRDAALRADFKLVAHLIEVANLAVVEDVHELEATRH